MNDDLKDIYEKAENKENNFLENTDEPVAPEPQILEEPKEETTEEESGNQVEEGVSEEIEEGQKEEITKPLTTEEKLKKRINTITAQKKALEENKKEEIDSLKQEIEDLKSRVDNPKESDNEYTLEDVNSEIQRVENLISSGESDEVKADGNSHNLNIYLNRLTREHNRMYVESQRKEAETNVNNTNSKEQALQNELINVEKEIVSITGVSDLKELNNNPLVQITKALLINQPKKFDKNKLGGATAAFHEALKMCVQDGLFTKQSNAVQTNKPKSAIIPGINSGAGSSVSKNSPISNNENENKDYLNKMMGHKRKLQGLA